MLTREMHDSGAAYEAAVLLARSSSLLIERFGLMVGILLVDGVRYGAEGVVVDTVLDTPSLRLAANGEGKRRRG